MFYAIRFVHRLTHSAVNSKGSQFQKYGLLNHRDNIVSGENLLFLTLLPFMLRVLQGMSKQFSACVNGLFLDVDRANILIYAHEIANYINRINWENVKESPEHENTKVMV